jgi:diadenosine tetraphosphate (Ap4A) HIT family hydrolase
MTERCDACHRLTLAARGEDPLLIAEFPGSWLFLGDHQYYEGYSVLYAKPHARELHLMPEDELSGLMSELMRATRAIQAAFDPWKMNHASLGNMVQHVHWHIFPRYESDDDRFQNPWRRMDDFKSRVPDAKTRDKVIAMIRKHLA